VSGSRSPHRRGSDRAAAIAAEIQPPKVHIGVNGYDGLTVDEALELAGAIVEAPPRLRGGRGLDRHTRDVYLLQVCDRSDVGDRQPARDLVRFAFKFAARAFLHEKWYEIAYSAGCEPGVLRADEGVDNQGRRGRKLVNQSSLDIR
jgi:hypothetical protein